MEDLELAKRTIVSLVQRQSFSEELQDLKRNDGSSIQKGGSTSGGPGGASRSTHDVIIS